MPDPRTSPPPAPPAGPKGPASTARRLLRDHRGALLAHAVALGIGIVIIAGLLSPRADGYRSEAERLAEEHHESGRHDEAADAYERSLAEAVPEEAHRRRVLGVLRCRIDSIDHLALEGHHAEAARRALALRDRLGSLTGVPAATLRWALDWKAIRNHVLSGDIEAASRLWRAIQVGNRPLARAEWLEDFSSLHAPRTEEQSEVLRVLMGLAVEADPSRAGDAKRLLIEGLRSPLLGRWRWLAAELDLEGVGSPAAILRALLEGADDWWGTATGFGDVQILVRVIQPWLERIASLDEKRAALDAVLSFARDRSRAPPTRLLAWEIFLGAADLPPVTPVPAGWSSWLPRATGPADLAALDGIEANIVELWEGGHDLDRSESYRRRVQWSIERLDEPIPAVLFLRLVYWLHHHTGRVDTPGWLPAPYALPTPLSPALRANTVKEWKGWWVDHGPESPMEWLSKGLGIPLPVPAEPTVLLLHARRLENRSMDAVNFQRLLELAGLENPLSGDRERFPFFTRIIHLALTDGLPHPEVVERGSPGAGFAPVWMIPAVRPVGPARPPRPWGSRRAAAILVAPGLPGRFPEFPGTWTKEIWEPRLLQHEETDGIRWTWDPGEEKRFPSERGVETNEFLPPGEPVPAEGLRLLGATWLRWPGPGQRTSAHLTLAIRDPFYEHEPESAWWTRLRDRARALAAELEATPPGGEPSPDMERAAEEVLIAASFLRLPSAQDDVRELDARLADRDPGRFRAAAARARLLAGDVAALDLPDLDAVVDGPPFPAGSAPDFWARVILSSSDERIVRRAWSALEGAPLPVGVAATLERAIARGDVDAPESMADETRGAHRRVSRRHGARVLLCWAWCALWMAAGIVALGRILLPGQGRGVRLRQAFVLLVCGFACLTIQLRVGSLRSLPAPPWIALALVAFSAWLIGRSGSGVLRFVTPVLAVLSAVMSQPRVLELLDQFLPRSHLDLVEFQTAVLVGIATIGLPFLAGSLRGRTMLVRAGGIPWRHGPFVLLYVLPLVYRFKTTRFIPEVEREVDVLQASELYNRFGVVPMMDAPALGSIISCLMVVGVTIVLGQLGRLVWRRADAIENPGDEPPES